VVWDQTKPLGGQTPQSLKAAKVILWKGHCSVHGRFTAQNVIDVRKELPGVNILVHPECKHEVVSQADYVGSTEKIIETLQNAPAGSKWAIGTELNLVRRLAQQFPDKHITYLDKTICYCSTMNRIDLPHLVWILEAIADNRIHNVISVDKKIASEAKVALDRMLALPATTAPLD
jgi:quinolinate synthase